MPWFMHVLTGGRDLLDVTLRVKSETFDEHALQRRLGVKTLDEREDLPVYGQWSRVRVRSTRREHDDIRLHLRDFKDVNRTTFKRFLTTAAKAYFDMVEHQQAEPESAQPWKTDGRNWHLSQQSMHGRQRARWQPQALLELIGRLSKLDPTIRFDWTGKVAVGMKHAGCGKPFGKIVTNMGRGMRCEVRTVANLFTPVQIDRLAVEPTVRRYADHDSITFWCRSVKECDPDQLARLLANTRDTVTRTKAVSA